MRMFLGYDLSHLPFFCSSRMILSNPNSFINLTKIFKKCGMGEDISNAMVVFKDN